MIIIIGKSVTYVSTDRAITALIICFKVSSELHIKLG